MHRIWRFAVGLGFAGLAGHLSAIDPGSASGTSETAIGRQQTIFAFTGISVPPALTPQSAFIDFGVDAEPVGIASNGTITLRIGYFDAGVVVYGTPARWRNGTTSLFQVPPASLYSYPNAAQNNLRFVLSPETGIGGLSRNGVIAAPASDERPNETRWGIDREYFTVVWPANSDTPGAIKQPTRVVGNDDVPGQINRYSRASPLAVDNGDGVWVEFEDVLVPNLFVGGSTSSTPAFNSGQMGSYDISYDGARWISIFDVNSKHQAVGAAYLDDFHFGYFVGAPANWVDFMPLAINDAGQVLGDDYGLSRSSVWPVLKAEVYGAHLFQSVHGNEVAAPFVRSGSQKHYLQGVEGAGAVRVSGFDEEGNVYGSIGASYEFGVWLTDPGQNVIWVAKPTDWGLSDDTPAYTPIVWETPSLPAGYMSLYGVLPGARRVELGLAARTESDGSSSVHGFALVPAQLRVDFNRDGVIDTGDTPGVPDREFVEKSLPYFFWVNDDDDSGETSGDDIPGQPPERSDACNGHVDGVRDLVDFFPVYLDIKRLLEFLPPTSGLTYKLSHQTGALGYVPTELTPANTGDFLRDVATATGLANAPVTPIPPEGVALPAEFLEKIRTSDKGIILVEASAPTNFPLALDIWKGSDRIATLELPLSIDSIEHMFRHVNLSGAAGAGPETMSRSGVSNWDDRLSSTKVMLFVHGYNVNQQQARGWHAEVFKRLWWAGSRARFWGVTWFGCESQNPLKFTPDYHSNVVNAFATAPQFASFVAALRSEGATAVSVAAHSLGNMVVSSAITDHAAAIDQYFLLDAAVAAESYDAAKQQQPTAAANMPHTDWTRKWSDVYPSRLWASEWYERFPLGDERHRLTWRDRFSSPAGTAFYNLFSSGEEVLDADDGTTRSIAGVLWNELYHVLFQDQPNGTQAWVYQEKLKGRTITGKVVGSDCGGWGFNTFEFSKVPDVPGKGPVIAPNRMSPAQARAAADIFTDTVLQAVPFFDPGNDGEEVASWVPASDGSGGYRVLREPLGLLYGQSGSAFASQHRDTLLARMIPAMSLAAGREAIEAFTPPNEPSRNLDMNEMKTSWPLARQGSNSTRDRWLHSDLRDVAFPYVRTLYGKLVELGALDSP